MQTIMAKKKREKKLAQSLPQRGQHHPSTEHKNFFTTVPPKIYQREVNVSPPKVKTFFSALPFYYCAMKQHFE